MTNKPEFRKEKLNRKPSSRVNSFNKVYSVIVNKDGSTSIIFGDATEGGRLPSGEGISVVSSYRQGSGEAGNVPNEKQRGVEHFPSRTKAIEFLGQKIVTELKNKISDRQGFYLVYLDVWTKDVTYSDDPAVRGTALGEADDNGQTDKTLKRKKKP